MVYFPPGAYTSGTLHLRSHVTIHLEAGATLYSSKDPDTFDQRALFYGEDLENITLEGRGTVDGQAEYEWRLSDMMDRYIYSNQVVMEKAGLPLTRAFPTANSIGNLVLLIRCVDVRIANLSLVRSPSWTIHPWGCERVVIDGVYIRTSLETGVWADGIDPDGCKDVRISNSTIETGDDAIVFYSSSIYGPARPCENITITNCRLSSASSALKFCDGNLNAIRNVTMENCVITGSNRGIAFMVFDGGIVENVVLANLTVECRVFDWFWWGEADPLHFRLIRRSELDPNVDKSTEPPVGAMRNIIIRNVIARGMGSCTIEGHPDSWLENIAIENVRLEIAHNVEEPMQRTVDALTLRRVRNFRLKDVEIVWQGEPAPMAGSALVIEEAEDLVLDGVSARQAQIGSDMPAIRLKNVRRGVVRNCVAQEGTGVFIRCSGRGTRRLVLDDNDMRRAVVPVALTKRVRSEVRKD
jgi:polygalacturonase